MRPDRQRPKDPADSAQIERHCSKREERLHLLRVVGAPGVPAERIIATVRALEAFLDELPAEQSAR